MSSRPPREPKSSGPGTVTTVGGVDEGGTPPSSYVLLVTGFGHLHPYHHLGSEVVIGRADECDVVIAHKSASRRHAILRLGPPVTVQDLGSTNGTRIGREQFTGGDPVPLGEGDTFHIGPFTFVLVPAHSGAQASSRSGRDRLCIDDPTFEHASQLLRDVAESDVTVLIQAETGAGKEVLADTLHRLSRRPGQMVRINCAALSESLLESELFGHEKGAFTGATGSKAGLLESAQGGTVFLDEVGELPLGIQAKLLRALEAREVLRVGSTRPVRIDARFVAATNRDLIEEVEALRFRRDLYFRLDGITLYIPPLRERRPLIVPLALEFLHAAATRQGLAGAPSFEASAVAALGAYGWPGNVRELKAVMERALLLAHGKPIGERHLAFGATGNPASRPPQPVESVVPTPAPPSAQSEFSPEEAAERDRIIAVLEACAGNQTRAAKLLSMSRTTLVTKLRVLRIPRPRGR